MQYAGSQYAGSQYNGTGYSNGGSYANGGGYSGQQQSYGYPGQYYQQPPQPIQQQYSGQQQQQYGSTSYGGGNVPFPQPQPSPNNVPAVLQPPAPQQPVHRPPRSQTPHPTVSRRRAGSSTRKPIKSALKDPDRNRRNSANGPLLPVPSQRTRRYSSGAENRPRANSIVRQRTNSGSRADPGTRPHIRLCAMMPFMMALSFIPFFFLNLTRFIKTTFLCR